MEIKGQKIKLYKWLICGCFRWLPKYKTEYCKNAFVKIFLNCILSTNLLLPIVFLLNMKWWLIVNTGQFCQKYITPVHIILLNISTQIQTTFQWNFKLLFKYRLLEKSIRLDHCLYHSEWYVALTKISKVLLYSSYIVY